MSQVPKYYYPILKELEEGPLDGKEIINRITGSSEKKSPNTKKLYTKAFTRLLKEGKIHIEGYTGKWVQSLDAKDFRYSLVQNEPSMISNIIIKALNGDLPSKNELKSKFTQRMKQLVEKNKNWESLISTVIKSDLTDKEIKHLKSGGIFEYNLYKLIFRKQEYREINSMRQGILLNFPEKSNHLYKNAKIYFFEPKIVENLSFRKDPQESIVLDKNFFLNKEKPEKILEMYGIYRPIGVETENFEELFEHIFVFINSKSKNYRESLIRELSWALSDDISADKYLNQILYQYER